MTDQIRKAIEAEAEAYRMIRLAQMQVMDGLTLLKVNVTLESFLAGASAHERLLSEMAPEDLLDSELRTAIAIAHESRDTLRAELCKLRESKFAQHAIAPMIEITKLRAENEKLRSALEGMLEMIETADLVRNTCSDADFMVFMRQGARIIERCQAAQQALADGIKNET